MPSEVNHLDAFPIWDISITIGAVDCHRIEGIDEAPQEFNFEPGLINNSRRKF